MDCVPQSPAIIFLLTKAIKALHRMTTLLYGPILPHSNPISEYLKQACRYRRFTRLGHCYSHYFFSFLINLQCYRHLLLLLYRLLQYHHSRGLSQPPNLLCPLIIPHPFSLHMFPHLPYPQIILTLSSCLHIFEERGHD